MATLSETLGLILLLTKTNALRWVEVKSGVWKVSDSPVALQIEYLRPLLPDGSTPGNDIARITIGGYVDEVCAGTEGMDLVRKILDAAFPAQADWSQGCQEKLDDSFRQLEALLPSNDPAPAP